MATFIRNFPTIVNNVLYSTNVPTFDVKRGIQIGSSEKTLFNIDTLSYEMDFREHTGVDFLDTQRTPIQERVHGQLEHEITVPVEYSPTGSGLIYNGNSIAFGTQYEPLETIRDNKDVILTSKSFGITRGTIYTWARIGDPAGLRDRTIFNIRHEGDISYALGYYFGFYAEKDNIHIELRIGLRANGDAAPISLPVTVKGLHLFVVNSITGEYYIDNYRVPLFDIDPDNYVFNYNIDEARVQFLEDTDGFNDYKGYNIEIITHKQFQDISFSRTDINNLLKAGPQKGRERLIL